MKAEEVVFKELLSQNTQYVVPLYQRTYSWDEKQWEQIWDDLIDIYTLSSPRNHFIGSVVTQQVLDAPQSIAQYTLIDGQQRMTTLFILLSVIQQRAQKEMGTLASEIGDTYLFNNYRSGNDRFKLMPTQRDRNAFKAMMNGNTPPVGTQIHNAREYFDKMIENGDSEDKEFNLQKLQNCIVSHLDMVSISLHENDSPNRIFESLNNTGMPLSVADLIRNYLLMNIPNLEHQERAYDKLWYPMEQSFPKEQITTGFFWRYLMMDGSLPRQDDTYEEVQERFKNYTTPKESATALKDFTKFARYYVQVIGHDKSGLDATLLRQIRRLNQWEVAVAYPFLMRSMDNVASGNISQDNLVEVMHMIESFVIRRQVCGVPTNSLRSIFARMSSQVDYNNFVESSRNHLLENGWPSDDNFREQFVDFHLYSRGRIARARLVLWTLEHSFNHKETPEQSNEITIEHIMPQTLSDKWKEHLGPDWPDIHTQWLDTIGNLTLSGYNPELGNKPYTEKQHLLGSSNFALSKSLQQFETWNQTSIQQRANELADSALLMWKR